MSSLVVGIHSWHLTRQTVSLVFPQFRLVQTSCRSLTEPQHNALERVQQILETVCLQSNFDSSNLKINVDKGHTVTFFGKASNAVISIGVYLLQGIVERRLDDNQPFIEAYETRINRLSDDPEQIERALKHQDSYELRYLIALHEKCGFMLTSEELHFILAHEIAGHAHQNDNIRKVALALTVTVLACFALRLIFPELPFVSLVAAAAVIDMFVNALASRKIELWADERAKTLSSEAKKGALTFFKRHFAVETALQELKNRGEGDNLLLRAVSGGLNRLSTIHYPTTRERLTC